MEKATLKVTGMSCNHCVRAVTEALSELKSAANVLVSLEEERATLDFDPALVTVADMQAAIVEAGFAATSV